jgi:hypothetical protein
MQSARRKRDLVEEFWDEETLVACRQTAPRVRPGDFLDVLRARLGATGRLWATPSARAALRDFLSWTVSASRRCVLVCSLNCRAVTEEVRHAGMRVDTFDLTDTAGRIDWGTVAGQLRSWHGAVVVPHLFSVPSDLRPVLVAARTAGVLVVEDCAHTLGARIGASVAGTLGDAAIFSFDYDKPISLGGGGALLVNNPRLWPAMYPGWPMSGLACEERELRSFLRFMASRRGAITTADSAPRRLAIAFRHSGYGRLGSPGASGADTAIVPGHRHRPAARRTGPVGARTVRGRRRGEKRTRYGVHRPHRSGLARGSGRISGVAEAVGDAPRPTLQPQGS